VLCRALFGKVREPDWHSEQHLHSNPS
jgi:hypothetical protein